MLGLGGQARMNTPGVAEGNWAWRLREGDLTPELAQRLAEIVRSTGRARRRGRRPEERGASLATGAPEAPGTTPG